MKLYVLCILPPAIVLAATFFQPFVPPSWLLRDWAGVAADFGVPNHTPIYYGLVSNLGVMLWVSAASVCILMGLFFVTRSHEKHTTLFFICSGMFTTVMAVDDFFMVHEVVFEYLTNLMDLYLILIYIIVFCIYLIVFRKIILQHHFMLLVLASIFFAISVATDVFLEDMLWESDFFWFLEDGMKFFGIWAWVVFWYRTALDTLAATRPC